MALSEEGKLAHRNHGAHTCDLVWHNSFNFMLIWSLPRLFGFLLGVTLAGGSAYYYVIDEYKLSNDMLTEDIYVCIPP